jgi:flagellar biosynthesis/type III secretory pathway protein FliH
MAEVAALPDGHPERDNTLNLLVSYRIELAAKQNPEPEEQELVMQLSPLYLEQLEASRQVGLTEGKQLGKQLGELKGRQDIVLKLLVRQVGQLSKDLEEQVKTLSMMELDSLVDDLLHFGQIDDLLQWLQENRS